MKTGDGDVGVELVGAVGRSEPAVLVDRSPADLIGGFSDARICLFQLH